jgi:hypothetical protein
MPAADAVSMVISSKSEEHFYLHVLAKRTYMLSIDGRASVADVQVPLALKPAHHAPSPSGYAAAKIDPDLFCVHKSGTDLVVQGSAFSTQAPVEHMEVTISLGRDHTLRRLRVIGDRRVEFHGAARTSRFTQPERFSELPLTYDRAYGGKDHLAEHVQPDEAMDWFQRYSKVPRALLSSYLYARNPAGRGYLVYDDRAAIEALMLPNVEDPDDLLSPERLCVGHPDAWPRAPLPAGLDWYEQSWFPRVAHAGFCRPYRGTPNDFHEVRTGTLDASHVATTIDRYSLPRPDVGFFHGASPRLQLPTLQGEETFVVTGMHPRAARVEMPLPRERPRILLEPPGAHAIELDAALRTVILAPDRGEVVTVWAARVEVTWPMASLTERSLRHAVRWTPTP